MYRTQSQQLVRHAAMMMQVLRPSSFFPYYMYIKQNPIALYVVQEHYEQNCEQILGWHTFGSTRSATPVVNIPDFDLRRFFAEVLMLSMRVLLGTNASGT